MCGQTNHDGGRFCDRETSGIGQRTLQLGYPSGGVNFFNAICRLLMYEGSFSTRFSDLLISSDSFVCAESGSAGVGLRSAFSVSIDPLQLINAMVLSSAIILNSRQAGCTRCEKCFEVATHGWHKPQTRCAPMLDSGLGQRSQDRLQDDQREG